MTVNRIIALARKHAVPGEDSARICLADAVRLYDAGDYEAAKDRAIKSLSYSVGVFHPDYKTATR